MHVEPQRKSRRRTAVVTTVVAVVVVAMAVGLWAFQPWKVFTSSTVDEALPAVTGEPATTGAPAQPPAGGVSGSVTPTQPEQPQQPAEPTVLVQGDFVSQEHDTSGVAKVVRLGDGSRLLRLENFATSDGPDVHVWLTDQSAGGEWGKYDDGWYLALGKIKGTHGNQNYEIPADADLANLRSVVIWCDRFNVAFGSASLPV